MIRRLSIHLLLYAKTIGDDLWSLSHRIYRLNDYWHGSLLSKRHGQIIFLVEKSDQMNLTGEKTGGEDGMVEK